MKAIISEVNKLRVTYNKEIKNLNNETLKKLSKDIRKNKILNNLKCSQYLLDDIECMIVDNSLNLNKTKLHINASECNFIFSIFNAPYTPSLGVEAFYFEKIQVDEVLHKYQTNVLPILIKEASKGFFSAHTVALFPENHISGEQLIGDKIFYFVNKFALRHANTTQKILKKMVTSSSFNKLKAISYQEIESAVVYWVWLHEYHHQTQGFLPIPKYLKLKSIKILAGLEELRVDLGSMLLCVESYSTMGNMSEFVFQFILSERLLRYGTDGVQFNINGSENPSYDALSSYMFFNYLIENNGISIQNNKIHLNDNLINVLKELLQKIYAIEALISTKSETEVKEELLNFSHKLLCSKNEKLISANIYYKYLRHTIL